MSGVMPSARSVCSGRGHNTDHQLRSGIEVACNTQPSGMMETLRLAAQEGVAKHLELARVRLALRAAKGVDGRTDPNIHEAAVFHHFLPGCTRQTTGNSGRPQVNVGDSGGGHKLSVGDVSKLQMPAGLQHAPYLAEHPLLVSAEVDDAIGNDGVCPAIIDGKPFEKALSLIHI